MTYGLTPRQKEARGVVTNGEGKRTTAHLNLTVTMEDADVMFAREIRSTGPVPSLPVVKMSARTLPVQRPPFAGYDPSERPL